MANPNLSTTDAQQEKDPRVKKRSPYELSVLLLFPILPYSSQTTVDKEKLGKPVSGNAYKSFSLRRICNGNRYGCSASFLLKILTHVFYQ